MDFNEIISNSFKYPFTDFKNLAVIFALFFLASIFYIGVMLDDRNVFIVGIITFIIVCLIAPGYLISVIRNGTLESNEIPSLKISKNIADTFKLIILNIVYMIIPTILAVIIITATAWLVSSIPMGMNASGIDPIVISTVISVIVIMILFVIFSLLLTIAIARLARYDSLSEALSFRKVYTDIKSIGIGRFIAWAIIIGILLKIVERIAMFLLFLIPYAGIPLYICIVIPILLVVYSYSLGLLYSNVSGSDLASFERELVEFRIKKRKLL